MEKINREELKNADNVKKALEEEKEQKKILVDLYKNVNFSLIIQGSQQKRKRNRKSQG